MKSLIGKTLKNRYRVEESLGHGGMADVYKVWDLQRDVPLAMKVLREDLAHDVVFLKRFEREAKTLSKLQHPNIVRFYGLEQDDMLVFMLMDYIEGESLREEIFRNRGKGMSLDRILEIMHPVCSALNYAHQSGIVHCDLKPGNILIDKNGKVFISDFGIARHIDASTSTMVGIGTPAYMAPELIKGQDPTPQTDIYALGIVLYEMLTGGERPFTGERATITGTTADKVRWEHLQLKPTPIEKYNSQVSSQVEEAVWRCLSKNPRERYNSTMELLDDLKKTIGEKEQNKEKVEKKQPEKMAQPVAEKELKEPTKENKPRKKVSVWGLVLAGVVVLGMIVGIPTVNKVERNRAVQTEYTVTNKAELQTTASSEVTNTYISSDRVNNVEWECVYQVQNGDTLGQIFSRFNLNFSLEQDSFYYYEYCEFNGSNSTCSWKRQVDNYNKIYPEIWLIINSHEEGKNGWESESCLSGGGFIYFLTNLEETQSSDPIDTITPVYEIGSTMVSLKDGMAMVYIPEGEFLMGSEDGDSDEKPEHTVYLNAYWIDQTEVTNAQYQQCVKDGACSSPYRSSSYSRNNYYGNSTYADYPVIYVNWNQANDYCEWAGRRLPTEAEWEKAARGTDGRTYPWGEESPNADLANYNINVGDTTEVGSYPAGASPYGTLDMAGNVWEWVADWYGGSYYDSSPLENPQGPASGDYRVVRGGSWDLHEGYLRTANRLNLVYDNSYYSYPGFRCALSPDF